MAYLMYSLIEVRKKVGLFIMVLWQRQTRRRMGNFGQGNGNIKTMNRWRNKDEEANMKVNEHHQTFSTWLILPMVLVGTIMDLKIIPYVSLVSEVYAEKH